MRASGRRLCGWPLSGRVLFFMRCLLPGLLLLPGQPAQADGFDYYTLAVTLTPAFCDLNPGKRNSVQCRDRKALSLHGLWPEKNVGRAPASCRGPALGELPAADERELRRLMPDGSFRRYQWEKHGRCSGLAPPAYFRLMVREFNDIKWPPALDVRGRDTVMERDALLKEFRRLNPSLPEKSIVLRCDGRDRPPLLMEVRLCLSPDGKPGNCVANFRPNCPVALRIRAR